MADSPRSGSGDGDSKQAALDDSLVRAIVRYSPNAIITIDEHGAILSFNPTAERMFGYAEDEVRGKNVSLLMPEPYHAQHDAYIRRYLETGETEVIGRSGRELVARHRDGSTFPVEIMVAEMFPGGRRRFLGFVHDITARRQQREDLLYAATHDPLTGLANRLRLVSRMRELMAGSTPFLLLYIGIDRFQTITEVLGHDAGDRVLIKVGNRLAHGLDGDELLAHIGGSAFALLHPGNAGAPGLARVVYGRMDDPLQLGECSVDADVSIGIVSFPEHGSEADNLLRCGQVAMHAARDRQVSMAIYDEEMHTGDIRQLALAGELRQAIDRGELVPFFQPKVSIRDRRFAGVEALVRWRHPEKGMIRPDLFIPLAEETGIIHPFTHWLLEAVTGQMHTWAESGLHVPVAVNLAPRNLLEADLTLQIEGLLTRYSIASDMLWLEITERGFIADPDRALATLDRCRGLGLRISIDDFGTGYSSLTYLKELSPHEIKIDRSFIGVMEENAESLTIVQTLIQMARFLGMEVTAEGVEKEEDWMRLEIMGCDRAQGYYLGRPMPADELERWLAESPWSDAGGTAENPE